MQIGDEADRLGRQRGDLSQAQAEDRRRVVGKGGDWAGRGRWWARGGAASGEKGRPGVWAAGRNVGAGSQGEAIGAGGTLPEEKRPKRSPGNTMTDGSVPSPLAWGLSLG
jgi:hypothetical protein